MLTYEHSYDSGRHWKDIDRESVMHEIARFWNDATAVLREIDSGEVMSYRSYRVCKKGADKGERK